MSFAGGGWPSVGVMAVIVAAALRIHTDGNAGGSFSLALLECGMGWGNAGVGNLTGGFVPGTDIAYIIVSLFMKKSQRPNAKKNTKSVICQLLSSCYISSQAYYKVVLSF